MAKTTRRKASHHKKIAVHHAKVRAQAVPTRFVYYGIGFVAIALFLASQATYTQNFTGKNVLGDESGSDQQQQQEQQQQQLQQQQQEQQQMNQQQNELEVQNQNGSNIKMKVEDNGAVHLEGEGPGGVHFQFQQQPNGEAQLEAVNDKGEKLATASGEAKNLENELKGKDISISSSDGEMEVSHNGLKVRTHFPLSVNPTTGQLTVTTPAGVKTVAVLPDDAIKNMLANGFLTNVASGSATATQSGIYQLAMHNGEPVYQISGDKTQRLFGLFPVTTPRTIYVSTQNGQPVAQTQSWLAQLVGFLSF